MGQWVNSGIPMPLPLSDYASAEYEGKIYIIGGINANTNLTLSTIYILNLSTKTWSTGTSLPVPLWRPTAYAVGGKVFVLGGEMNNPGYAADFNYYVYQYNIAANSWARTITIPISYKPGVTAHGGNIYVLGGYTNWANSQSSTAVYYFSASNPMQYYKLNATVPQFSNLTTMSSQTYENKIFSVSGSAMFQLDLETLEVTTLTGAPVYKTTPGTVLYHSEIWSANLGPSNEVDVYDILTGQWRTQTYFTASYAAGGIAAYADNLYWLPQTVSSGTQTIYTYGMVSISVHNAAPSSGFVNEKEDNTFSWSLMSLPATRQAKATFQWRAGTSGTINTLTVEGEATSITVSAGTFPDGSVQWRVMAEGQSGAVSAYTDWMTLTTVDEKPEKPTGLYPASGVRNGAEGIELSWLHNSPLSTAQSAYEIQVSYDAGGVWEDLSGRVDSAVPRHIAGPDSFQPGANYSVGWRVRTYNSDSVPGEWSDTAFFVVYPAPRLPSWRSVEPDRSRPLAEWIAAEQKAFQLQVLQSDRTIYDSSCRYGAATSHRVEEYLANGSYTFRVRIQNLFGLWSEWAGCQALVGTAQKLRLTLGGESVENGAKLVLETEVVLE